MPWRVYPKEQFELLTARYGASRVKLLHVVRHAEGTHNVQKQYRDPSNIDARLTPAGNDQCASLASRIQTDSLLYGNVREGICVVTSSMTRCVQTALQSFQTVVPRNTPFLAHECFRETVNYVCDARRSNAELATEFPRVDFSRTWTATFDAPLGHTPPTSAGGTDEIWSNYRRELGDDWDAHMESAMLYKVVERAVRGLASLHSCVPERQIVLCTHSAFLKCILNWGQEHPLRDDIFPEQVLDDREIKVYDKVFEYCYCEDQEEIIGEHKREIVEKSRAAFEEYMRRDYENCELRSFCILFHE